MSSKTALILVSSLMERMRHEGGQTMAEYGILIAVIAVVVIVAATLFGSSVTALFNTAAHKV
jgi:pilus assembly protein Flp/PilA